MNKHLQQTGRTTRQIADAIVLLRQGRTVFYLVHGNDQVRETMRKIERDWKGKGDGIRVQAIDFTTFDWDAMRPLDARRGPTDRVWIVDHSAVETQYAAMGVQIEEMTRIRQQIYQYTTGWPVAVTPMPPTFNAKVEF